MMTRFVIALLLLAVVVLLLVTFCSGCVVRVEPERPRPAPPLIRPVPIPVPVPHRDHWREGEPKKVSLAPPKGPCVGNPPCRCGCVVTGECNCVVVKK